MTRIADWAEPIHVEHMYRELFGSTLMLVDSARWDGAVSCTREVTMQRMQRALPPIQYHCEVFTELKVDESAHMMIFKDKSGEQVVELTAHPDSLWDLKVTKPGVQADERGLVQDIVLLKLLAYDCGPEGSMPVSDLED